MDDETFERWVSQFVLHGDEALLPEQWEHHQANPRRKRRAQHRPANRQEVRPPYEH